LIVAENATTRNASKEIEINMKTIFDWRNKLLCSLEILNGKGFSNEIVESDDKQLDINENDSQKLGEKSY